MMVNNSLTIKQQPSSTSNHIFIEQKQNTHTYHMSLEIKILAWNRQQIVAGFL